MIGEPVRRIDAYEKVTGKAAYVADLRYKFDRCLILKALRSPYAHARIDALDVERARGLPGVADIITGYDKGIDWGCISSIARVACGETLWAGQAVALVAAENEEAAAAAISAIHVEYTRLPHVLTWREAMEERPVSVVNPHGMPAGCGNVFHSPNVVGTYHLEKGDVDAAFAQADVVVAGEFDCGKKCASQLERAMAITEYNADGSMTVYCNCCGIHTVVKAALCEALRIPASRLRVVQPYTGGSFGNRNLAYVETLATLAAMRTKRTVAMEFSRDEMFTAAPSNWVCATRIRLGAMRDGTIIAKDVQLIEEIGAMVGTAEYTGRLSSSALTSVYAIENVRMDTCAVLTNTVPAGAYRGLGAPEASFGFETLLSRLADKLHMSPVALRLKNTIVKGGANDYGERITSIGVSGCLRAAAQAVGMEEPLLQPEGGVWRVGRGVACAGKQNAPAGRAEAKVWLHHDGSVELFVSCDNHGMGASTVMTQIAAEALGVPMEQIRLHIGDTSTTPYDHFSASSRAVYATGNAVRFACEDALDKLRLAAAQMAGVSKQMVAVKGGTAYIVGAAIDKIPVASLFAPREPSRQNTWGLLQGTPVEGVGRFSPGPMVQWGEDGRTPRMWNWYQYAAAAAQIAVNTKTGQIVLLKVANAADSGNPINPKLVESQIDGGTIMSEGFFLQEEIVYDQDGRAANGSYGEYKVPTVQNTPALNQTLAFICPDPLPDGPFGAKGMSESVVVPLGPAINAALYEATGVTLHHYPMTPERVLEALERKEAAANGRDN